MTVSYAGGGGNLARLFIDAMGEVEDPNTQRALQSIKQWSDRLEAVTQLLAGTGITLSPADGEGKVTISASGAVGGAVGWGSYQYLSGNSPITWKFPGGSLPTPGFDYSNGAPSSFTQFVFPANSITFLSVAVTGETSTNPLTSSAISVAIYKDSVSGGNALTGGETAKLTDSSGLVSDWWAVVTNAYSWDSVQLTGHVMVVGCNTFSNVQIESADISLLSVAHP